MSGLFASLGRLALPCIAVLLVSIGGTARACSIDFKAWVENSKKPERIFATAVFVGTLTDMDVSTKFATYRKTWERAYRWMFDVTEPMFGKVAEQVVVVESLMTRPPKVKVGEDYIVSVMSGEHEPFAKDVEVVFGRHFCSYPYVLPVSQYNLERVRNADFRLIK